MGAPHSADHFASDLEESIESAVRLLLPALVVAER
jgi:hypothetical protein